MTTDRDEAPTRRYREASAALDERPSAATRAAILAAAARHVDAKPRAADAPRATQRRRWPLAAAAAVLLSTLAVMVAQRTEQEMPTFTAPAERSAERVAGAPAAPAAPPTPTPDVKSETRAAAPSASPGDAAGANGVIEDRRPASVAPDVRAKKSATVDAAEEPAIAASRVAESTSESPAIAANAAKPGAQATREQDTASTGARRAIPSAPAAPSPAPPPVVEQPARPEMGAASSAGEAARMDVAPASRAARKELAPAPAPSSGALRQEPQRDFERSPQNWLEHIVKLRGEGRNADADVELKRFRERYPDVQVPSAALPPAAPATGTR